MAEIWMVFGAEEYKYGTYRFVTRAEKNRVNSNGFHRNISRVVHELCYWQTDSVL